MSEIKPLITVRFAVKNQTVFEVPFYSKFAATCQSQLKGHIEARQSAIMAKFSTRKIVYAVLALIYDVQNFIVALAQSFLLLRHTEP